MTELRQKYFSAAAADADPARNRQQQCEAYFYAGSKRLIAGDKTTARDYFQKCLATGVKNFCEYQSAAADLKALNATP